MKKYGISCAKLNLFQIIDTQLNAQILFLSNIFYQPSKSHKIADVIDFKPNQNLQFLTNLRPLFVVEP